MKPAQASAGNARKKTTSSRGRSWTTTEAVALDKASSRPTPLLHQLNPRESVAALIAALSIVTFLTFHLVDNFDFVDWDDGIQVFHNPYFRAVNVHELTVFWLRPYQQLYIPLAYSVFGLLSLAAYTPDAQTVTSTGAPFNPHVFHAANLILHLTNVILVFLLLRRLVRHDFAAAAGTMIFAIHPIQVESVAWISELRGLLGATFMLTAVHLFLLYESLALGRRKVAAGAAFTACMLLSICAMLSKPSFVVIGLFLTAFAYWGCCRPLAMSVLTSLPFLVVGVAVVTITKHVQELPAGQVIPWFERPLIAADCMNFYLYKIIVPLKLGIDYGRQPGWLLHQWWVYVEWIIPVIVGAAAFRIRSRAPFILFGLSLSVVALLPVIGLIPFAFEHDSTTSDRYMYVALLGPAVIAAYGLQTLTGSLAKIIVGAIGVWLVWLAVLAFNQTQTWQNSMSLYTHATEVNPRSASAQRGLGDCYQLQHKFTLAKQRYRRALDLDPGNIDDIISLGTAYYGLRDYNNAELLFRQSIAASPHDSISRIELGKVLLSTGRPEEAKDQFEKALALNPSDYDVISQVAGCYLQHRDYSLAATAYTEGLKYYAHDEVLWRGLGGARLLEGNKQAAVLPLEMALRLDPADSLAAQMLVSLQSSSQSLPQTTPNNP